MIETTIILKDPSEWRPGMTKDKLIEELDRAIQFPGVTNSWTMPIKTRIDMLSTGIKTPVGIKVAGPDLAELERIGKEVEAVVKPLEGTLSAYAERVMGGNYLDFDIDREAAARFGLTGPTFWSWRRPVPRSRSPSSPPSASTRGRRRSSRRTPAPTPGSTWTCAESTSAPGSSERKRWLPTRSTCRRGTPSSGQASTSTCSGPRRGCC